MRRLSWLGLLTSTHPTVFVAADRLELRLWRRARNVLSIYV